ncbi:MAG: hypothetical protein ACPGYX_11680, partial [Oceanobacter sp.]
VLDGSTSFDGFRMAMLWLSVIQDLRMRRSRWCVDYPGKYPFMNGSVFWEGYTCHATDSTLISDTDA